MPRPTLTYPKTAANKVIRYASNAAYETTTIHSIVASVPVVHVSSVAPGDPPLPTILPMIGALGSFENPSAGLDEALDLYIHGYVSARLFRGREAAGFPVCVAATIVDGLVLALTPYSHSYNYRSAVLHGTATPVTDSEEKLYAMKLVTEHVLPGRWAGSRVPPLKAELDSTGILKVKITSASAKVRTGPPNDAKADLEDGDVTKRVWTGVVPTWTAYGEPVPTGTVDRVPEYVRDAAEGRTKAGKKTAEEAVLKAPAKV